MLRCLPAILPLLAMCVGGVAAELPAGVDEQAYRAEIETWQADRDTSLRRETGWLSIAGLFWLAPGENVVGSDPAARVVLPAGTAPERAAVLRVEEGAAGSRVTFVPEPDVAFVVDGEPVGERVLVDDGGVGAEAEVLTLGRVQFWIIERGGELAVRLRDPESPLRTGFRGVDNFPIDSSYRVVGRLDGLGEPRELTILNVLGQESAALTPGEVVFALHGELCRLLPLVDDAADSNLFFVFADATTGVETYEAGRFLSARLEADGTVVLDFNKAYNPPCAFNPFTTCPLPPEGNTLPLAVRAGEMDYREE